MKLNEKIRCARQFADMIHSDKGQRYGNLPYITHLEDVANTLLRFDITDKDLIAAAYLHDIIEDCDISLSLITELFGERTSQLVGAVTDEPGVNRKERKAKTYPKIKSTPGALIVKLADRIANVEHAVFAGNVRMFKMYQKEHTEFVQSLRTIGELDDMWEHLGVIIKTGITPKNPEKVVTSNVVEV